MTLQLNLWQLSALLWQAARTPCNQSWHESLTSQVNALLSCANSSAWGHAIEKLLAETDGPSDSDVKVNQDDDSVLAKRSALESLGEAWHTLQNRNLTNERLQAAIEARVAETMYNFCYGLSHEINNPLANISARAQGLKARLTDAAAVQSLDNIVMQTNRAHEMLAEMMLAVRLPQIILEPVDLRDFMVGFAKSLEAQAAHSQIQLQFNCDECRLPAKVNPPALSEALQAIVQNAINACEVGGTIVVTCKRIDPEVPTSIERGALPQICVTICDNGQGMTADQIKKAFDLYYCGREAGRSLGIGLAKTRRIIDAHGGTIQLTSQPKFGTAVEIRLPWFSSRNGF